MRKRKRKRRMRKSRRRRRRKRRRRRRNRRRRRRRRRRLNGRSTFLQSSHVLCLGGQVAPWPLCLTSMPLILCNRRFLHHASLTFEWFL